MTGKKYITIFSKRKEIELDAGSILYIMMNRDEKRKFMFLEIRYMKHGQH